MSFVIGQKVERRVRRRRSLSWEPCTVIEVVKAGDKPTKAGKWDFSPRNHQSYVVEEEGYWTRVWHPGQTFWPRAELLREEA